LAVGVEKLCAQIKSMPSMDGMVAGINHIHELFNGLEIQVMDVVEGLKSTHKETKAVVDPLLLIIQGLPQQLSSQSAETAVIRTESENLRKEVAILRSSGSHPLRATGFSAAGTDPIVLALQNQMAVMQKGMNGIIHSKDESVVSLGGFSFASLNDVQAWVKQFNPDARWDGVFDPLIILHRLVPTGGESLKDMETWNKLKLENADEALTMQTLDRVLPSPFHEGEISYALALDVSPLNQLKTFKSWKDGMQGLKPFLVSQLTDMNRVWKADLNEACYGRPEMKEVLGSLLTESHSFLLQLFEFIDDQYDVLKNISRFGTEPSWALVTSVLKRVLMEIQAPKKGILGKISSNNDKPHAAARILWSSLQSIRIVKRYLADGIQHHPSVVMEYVAFLTVRCNGSDKFDDFAAAQAQLESQVKSAEKSATVAQAKADSAHTKAAEALATVKAHGRKAKE
jgi:hypothetical protein